MTTRTHLSIGEVLSLLTDDFPDLTITKIRFLESQGLIDPERTASGYRKFYDFDIERLRWILRQQRENFLPLKVIKDRLDRSEGKLPDEATPEAGQAELNLARDPGTADPPPVWMADHAKSPRNREADREVDATDSRPEVPVETSRATEPGAAAPQVAKVQAPPAAGTVAEVASPPKAPAKSKPPKAAPDTAKTGADAMTDFSDVSLTRAELLSAADLDERQLTLLESFGIVAPSDGLGDATYGAEALVCARQAAVFLELGMEPRHLRAFKVAADREAGLYEQMVLPLLRQRNPAARAEATQLVGRLTAAGASLHAALLQQSMRAQLRPRR